MDPSPTSDPLSRLLASWLVAPRRSEGFRLGVRSRLQGKAVVGSWWGFVRRHASVVGVVLVVAVATGGIWGREQARARAASESAELARVYVQGLDARQMLMP